MRIIDMHNHFYPSVYLKFLRDGLSAVKTAKADNGNLLIVYEGDFNVVDRGHTDADFRISQIMRHGIDCQVLTMTTPGVHVEEPYRGAEIARAVNEEFSEITRRSGGHFEAFAALPLQTPERAAEELEYAVTKLGLRGGTLFTNINGSTLDKPEFEVVFATAWRLDVPLFVHPTTPIPSDAFGDYRLAATVGFPTDTTLCIARLIFAGIFDRFPGLKIIASHLGGTLPYLSERLDRGFAAYPECQRIERAPGEYLREIFYDCVLFNPLTVEYAVKMFGASQFVVGSDYPHQIGDLGKAVSTIRALPISDHEKDMILGKNAEQLLKS